MNDSDFDQMLRSARGPSPLPANFRSEVWRKIQAEAATVPQWQRWLESCLELLLRPPVAAAGVLATILLGATLGMSGKPDPVEAENHYIRSVSPFVQASR